MRRCVCGDSALTIQCHPDSVHSLTVWEQLLFASHQSPEQVYTILDTMISLGIRPSTSCFLLGLFTAFKSENEYHASRIFKEMFLRGQACNAACFLLFRMYIQRFSFVDAKELLQYVTEHVKHAELVPYYNLAIEKLSQAGFGAEAEKFYENFKNLNLQPDYNTNWALFALWCRSKNKDEDLTRWVKEKKIATNHPLAHRYFHIILTELWRRRSIRAAIEIFRYLVSNNVMISGATFVIMARVLCYVKDEEKVDGLLLLMGHHDLEPRLNIYNEILFMYATKPNCEEKFMRLFDKVRARGLLPDIDTISNLVVVKARFSVVEAKEIVSYYGFDNPGEAFIIANQGTTRLGPHGALDRILNLLLKIYMATQDYEKAWEVYNTLKRYRNKNTYLWLIKLYAATGKLGDVPILLNEMTANSITLQNAHYQQLITELLYSGEAAAAFTLYSQIKGPLNDSRLALAFRPLVDEAREDNLQMLYEIIKKSKDPNEAVELLVSLFINLEGDLRPLVSLLRRTGITPNPRVAQRLIDESLRRDDISLAAEINDRLLS